MNRSKANDPRISVREISKRYGIQESETLGAIKAGKLKASFHRMWAEWLINIEEFERWKKQRVQLSQP
jgi:hypothetical protein